MSVSPENPNSFGSLDGEEDELDRDPSHDGIHMENHKHLTVLSRSEIHQYGVQKAASTAIPVRKRSAKDVLTKNATQYSDFVRKGANKKSKTNNDAHQPPPSQLGQTMQLTSTSITPGALVNNLDVHSFPSMRNNGLQLPPPSSQEIIPSLTGGSPSVPTSSSALSSNPLGGAQFQTSASDGQFTNERPAIASFPPVPTSSSALSSNLSGGAQLHTSASDGQPTNERPAIEGKSSFPPRENNKPEHHPISHPPPSASHVSRNPPSTAQSQQNVKTPAPTAKAVRRRPRSEKEERTSKIEFTWHTAKVWRDIPLYSTILEV